MPKALLLPTHGFALFILLLLGMMSIVTWAVIGFKYFQLRRASRQNKAFYRLYKKAEDIPSILSVGIRFSSSPFARTLETLWREMNALRRKETPARGSSYRSRASENLIRATETAWLREYFRLQQGLTILSLVANTAPYIGLLGTVLGVIDAFSAIGVSGVTSLSVVAPGLSEALIATAAGLFAAIPALVLHQIFRTWLGGIAQKTQAFSMEVLNRIERAW